MCVKERQVKFIFKSNFFLSVLLMNIEFKNVCVNVMMLKKKSYFKAIGFFFIFISFVIEYWFKIWDLSHGPLCLTLVCLLKITSFLIADNTSTTMKLMILNWKVILYVYLILPFYFFLFIYFFAFYFAFFAYDVKVLTFIRC